MVKRWTALALGLLLLLMAACSDVEVQQDYTLEAMDEAEWTIMVYLLGSDLETDGGMASGDLEEMIAAEYDREDVRVVVQTGGASLWWTLGVPDNNPARFLVRETDMALLEELPPQSMVEPGTLTDFIDYGMENFPAQRYGLVLWDHGAGSVWGFGYDEHDENNELTLAEINSALANSLAAQQKLEFIGFDACLMATLETAYACRDYAKYLVASEELEPGYGWDYDTWLSMLGDEPDLAGDELGRVIVDSFVAFYNENDMEDEATTLSLVDLSRVDAAVDALDDFVAVANLEYYEYQDIARPRAGTKEFGLPHEYGFSYDMIDIVHMARQFEQLCPAEAAALTAAVEDAVVHKSQGGYVENAGGLSLYFPYSEKDVTAGRLEVYRGSGFSQSYINYAIEFARVLTGATLAPLDDVAAATPQQSGTDAGEELEITLTPEQLANVANIYFTAWAHVDEDYYLQLYQNTEVEIDPGGRVLTEYEGYMHFIGGEPVCLYEIERGSDYVRYGVPALWRREERELEVDVLVVADAQSPQGRVVGAVPSATEGPAPKQTISLQKGDELTFYYYCEEFVSMDWEDDGTEAEPFWFEGDPMVVGDTLEVVMEDVPEGEYLYGFTVVDLQGNEYYTDFIVVDFWYE